MPSTNNMTAASTKHASGLTANRTNDTAFIPNETSLDQSSQDVQDQLLRTVQVSGDGAQFRVEPLATLTSQQDTENLTDMKPFSTCDALGQEGLSTRPDSMDITTKDGYGLDIVDDSTSDTSETISNDNRNDAATMVENNERSEKSLQGNENTAAYANHGASSQDHDDGGTEEQNETEVSGGECHNKSQGRDGSSRDCGEGNEGGYASAGDYGKQSDNDGGAKEHDEQGGDDSSPSQASRRNSGSLKSDSLCSTADISGDTESCRSGNGGNIITQSNSPGASLELPIFIEDNSTDTPTATSHMSKRKQQDELCHQEKPQRKKRRNAKDVIIRAKKLQDEQTEWLWNARTKHWEAGDRQRKALDFTSHDKLAIVANPMGGDSYSIEFTSETLWTGKQLDGTEVQFSEGSLKHLLDGEPVEARVMCEITDANDKFCHGSYTVICRL